MLVRPKKRVARVQQRTVVQRRSGGLLPRYERVTLEEGGAPDERAATRARRNALMTDPGGRL
jgi:hypothetical protein